MTEVEAAIFAAEKGLRPFGNQSDGQSRLCIWSKGWFNKDCPDELPAFLFDRLKYGRLDMGMYRYYHSRHAAYLDLYQAVASAMTAATMEVALSVGLKDQDAVDAVRTRAKKATKAGKAEKATRGYSQ